MSRKAISKATRLAVYDKCNHRCAYCGCELEYKDMQVDHLEAVYLNEYNKERNYKVLNDDELNDIENYLPACRACNFYKSTFTLEEFRKRLSTTLFNNLEKNFNYKLLKKYGLIKEDIKPVKFYFEKLREEE